jgi:methyl-accepting chemotaxis protein
MDGSDGPGGVEDASSKGSGTGDPSAALLFDNELLADAVPAAIFALDAERRVRCWNSGAEALTGTPREDVLGRDEVSVAFYQDGRRAMTLADKIVEAPETAELEYDVKRSTDVGYTRYEDTSTMLNADGEEVDIWFTATPVYDGDEFVGVVETVQDRTEIMRRRRSMEKLVNEVTGTLAEIGGGNLAARATFDDRSGALESELVEIVDQVNRTAENLDRVTSQVRARTQTLIGQIETTAEAANEIGESAANQRTDIGRVVDEMGSLSANMEEVAASAQEVAAAAGQARTAANAGTKSGERASEATEELQRTGEDLVDRVNALESYIERTVDVVDVIADIAGQTNLLALNANIEAARAGESGAGFEVVANEVKSLAEATRTHTEEIGAQMAQIREQTSETVSAVESSNDQIHEAGAEIADALAAISEIVGAVDEAAGGIDEVARANDEQAATVEEVTVLVETVEGGAKTVSERVDAVAETTREQERAVAELANEVEALTRAS